MTISPPTPVDLLNTKDGTRAYIALGRANHVAAVEAMVRAESRETSVLRACLADEAFTLDTLGRDRPESACRFE